jgi:hypothetical protein
MSRTALLPRLLDPLLKSLEPFRARRTTSVPDLVLQFKRVGVQLAHRVQPVRDLAAHLVAAVVQVNGRAAHLGTGELRRPADRQPVLRHEPRPAHHRRHNVKRVLSGAERHVRGVSALEGLPMEELQRVEIHVGPTTLPPGPPPSLCPLGGVRAEARDPNLHLLGLPAYALVLRTDPTQCVIGLRRSGPNLFDRDRLRTAIPDRERGENPNAGKHFRPEDRHSGGVDVLDTVDPVALFFLAFLPQFTRPLGGQPVFGAVFFVSLLAPDGSRTG